MCVQEGQHVLIAQTELHQDKENLPGIDARFVVVYGELHVRLCRHVDPSQEMKRKAWNMAQGD